ncbi:MAG: murein biosynthesis integral membrane protein MurJ [Anaerohalosphaeraceae bacterium]|nr:murein biosynthesis integral membrane protein MurJ [Anaerohalosphaeraceae bacterium]
MFKGFKQIVILTVISRILGMVRDMAFAFFFGAGGVMDAWIIAFMVPNLSRRIFGEGAASSSLIPVYSEQLHKNPKDTSALASTVVTVLFVVLSLLVLAGELAIWIWFNFFSKLESTDLILSLTALMLPYMVMICMVAIVGGILNSHRHFAMPAFAPVLLNVFIIGSLFFSGWVLSISPESQLFFVAAAVLIAGVLQLLLQLWPLRASGVKLRPAWQVRTDAFKKIMLLMAPMIIGLTATQLNTLADVLIARIFSGSIDKGQEFMFFGRQLLYPMWDGAASKLYYAQRLYQFPLGVFGISLATAIFPVMSSDAAKADIGALCRTVSKGIKGAVFIAAPAMLGLILVRKDLVSLVFQRGEFTAEDTAITSSLLVFYSLGLSGFFLQQLAGRAFYSLKDSKIPTRSAIIAVCVNLVLNLALIWPMGVTGLALATAVCSYLQVAILLFALNRKIGSGIFAGFLPELFRTIAGAALMYAAGIAVMRYSAEMSGITRLALTVLVSVAVYTVVAKLLKTESLALLFKRRGD